MKLVTAAIIRDGEDILVVRRGAGEMLAGFWEFPGGTQFHFLQAFWYRYLVDIKFAEVERYIKVHAVSPKLAIDHVLGIKLS